MDQEAFHELSQYDVRSELVRRLPVGYCVEKMVVVLDEEVDDGKGWYVVGMLNPDKEELVRDVEERLDRPVKPVRINAYEIRRAIEDGFQLEPSRAEEMPSMDISHEDTIELDMGQSGRKMVKDLLSDAIQAEASDVHLETYRNDVDLRFRINGVLRQVNTPLARANINKVINVLKVLSELDLVERRHAQDGRFRVRFTPEDGPPRHVGIRLSIGPGPFAEEATIQILDQEQFILDLEELGFPEPTLDAYRQVVSTPSGMVLLAGPTGSGKTTTLYSTIREIMDYEMKILTVEDPIEYEFEKINQKQVSKQMGFADYTRAFLRQDPDIILVGEIRDVETARVSIRAATTGHLVFSTIHTSNPLSAISRLRTLEVDDDYISDVLLGVLSQRLVRLNCENCVKEVAPDPTLVNLFYEEEPKHPFHRGTGCDACNGTGYRGRTGVFEFLIIDDPLRKMIAAGTPIEEMKKHAIREGFTPLYRHAHRRIERGETSLEEVARVVKPPMDVRAV